MNPGLPIADNAMDFGVMLTVGIIVSGLFDMFRGLRSAVKRNGGKTPAIFVQLQDLFFAVIAFLFVVLAIYKINDGIVRSYIISGFSVGVLLYWCLIVRFAEKVFHWIFYVPIFIIRQIFKTLKAFCCGFGRFFKKIWVKNKKSFEKYEKI